MATSPPSDQEQQPLPLPLDELISLSIADTHKRTGWPIATIYDDINHGRLESYTKGRRRFVLAASVMRLITELAKAPPERTSPPRGKRGRFAKRQGDEAATATETGGKAPKRISRPVSTDKAESAAGASPQRSDADDVNLSHETSRDGTYPTAP